MTSGSPDGAYDNCYHPGYTSYCDFNGTSGRNLCFWSPGLYGSINWGNCRNHDESFANRSGGLVRLYYSPNDQGAYACVNNGWYSNDLNKDVYTFNNGNGAGKGQEIWENVASDHWYTGGCVKPLPEDG